VDREFSRPCAQADLACESYAFEVLWRCNGLVSTPRTSWIVNGSLDYVLRLNTMRSGVIFTSECDERVVVS
jgi:hypothetical protein